jgi:hypothetical protein
MRARSPAASRRLVHLEVRPNQVVRRNQLVRRVVRRDHLVVRPNQVVRRNQQEVHRDRLVVNA